MHSRWKVEEQERWHAHTASRRRTLSRQMRHTAAPRCPDIRCSFTRCRPSPKEASPVSASAESRE